MWSGPLQRKEEKQKLRSLTLFRTRFLKTILHSSVCVVRVCARVCACVRVHVRDDMCVQGVRVQPLGGGPSFCHVRSEVGTQVSSFGSAGSCPFTL